MNNNGVETQLHAGPKSESLSSAAAFEHTQRVAIALSKSDLVPKEFRGNVANTIIALEMAARIGASPLMVMQNLYLVHGKPSWSSTFIIAAINASDRFDPLRFDLKGTGDDMACIAWTTEKGKTERIEGPAVTMKMAKAEGWIDKAGSKWKTMPELMIRYRAAAFFGRLYTPHILMGMQTHEEVVDVMPTEVVTVNQDEVRKLKEAERLTFLIDDAKNLEELEMVEQYLTPEFQAAFDAKKSKLIDG